jgi:hypothetical protein
MKTREVEVAIGYTNKTWDTKMVEIPASTPYDGIEEVAELKAVEEFFNSPSTSDDVAFVSVYHIPDIPQDH